MIYLHHGKMRHGISSKVCVKSPNCSLAHFAGKVVFCLHLSKGSASKVLVTHCSEQIVSWGQKTSRFRTKIYTSSCCSTSIISEENSRSEVYTALFLSQLNNTHHYMLRLSASRQYILPYSLFCISTNQLQNVHWQQLLERSNLHIWLKRPFPNGWGRLFTQGLPKKAWNVSC